MRENVDAVMLVSGVCGVTPLQVRDIPVPVEMEKRLQVISGVSDRRLSPLRDSERASTGGKPLAVPYLELSTQVAALPVQ